MRPETAEEAMRYSLDSLPLSTLTRGRHQCLEGQWWVVGGSYLVQLRKSC